MKCSSSNDDPKYRDDVYRYLTAAQGKYSLIMNHKQLGLLFDKQNPTDNQM